MGAFLFPSHNYTSYAVAAYVLLCLPFVKLRIPAAWYWPVYLWFVFRSHSEKTNHCENRMSSTA
jgi:hypothetical protein